MFTGLISDVGVIVAHELQHDGQAADLTVETSLAGELVAGDSIAVSGVCLTATEVAHRRFRAHAIAETLRRSTLSGLRAGSRVNLELALRLSDRLGGHIVQGHVDSIGRIAALADEGSSVVLTVDVPNALSSHLVDKGSVALDGVSLTVSTVTEQAFQVSLIPQTLASTTLRELRVGDAVNIEVDVLSKHVQRLLHPILDELRSTLRDR